MTDLVRLRDARAFRALTLLFALLLSFARADARGPAGYDLSADLEASSDTASTGEQITLTLIASADDTGGAATADLTLTTPEGTGFVSASADGATLEEPAPGEAGTVHASFSGGVEAGASVALEVVVEVTAEGGSSLLFDGQVAGPNGSADDADSGNNEASTVVVVGSGGSADVAVELFPLGDGAGSGALYTYEVDVENVSDDDDSVAQGVAVTIPIPHGSTFASVSGLADECSAPAVGSGGSIVCVFDELGAGDAVEIEVTVAVTARPGTTLSFLASVDTASQDPDDGNNEASDEVPVVTSPPVMLDWDEPDAESSDALPPPRDLVVFDDESRMSRPSRPTDPRDTVVNYKVYGSPKPGVVPGAGGLLATIPPTQTSTTLPAAPAGTFYVVTATYADGESGPSNEASGLVPAATVTSVKISGSKVTAVGTAFSAQVQVLIDGIPFSAAAKVKKAGTKVIQKGALLTGVTLGAYVASHPSVTVMFRNSNGGVAAYAYPH